MLLLAPALSRALPADNPAAALRAPIAAEYFGSVRYYLSRYDTAPSLGDELAKKQTAVLAEVLTTSSPANMPLDGLLSSVARAIRNNTLIDAAREAALAAALKETAYYFSVSSAPVMEQVALPRRAAALPAPGPGFEPAIAGLSSASLPMRDLDGYLRGQLGPMAEVLNWLAPSGPSVLFSRRPFREAVRLLSPPPVELYRLNIPGSVYAFEAYLAYGGTPGPRLLLCGFAGDSWFFNVRSVYSLYFSRHGMSPEILVDTASPAALPCPGVMEAFSAGGAPRNFSGLLLGYYRELKDAFGPLVKREFSGSGFRAFEAKIGGRSYVAVETRDSWYGDILGATVKALLDSGVGFDSVYFAGSAGSLQYATPYSAVHPDCFFDGSGRRLELPNAVSGYGPGLCHQTAKSPLAESAAYLAALPPDAGTIDVEGIHLARAVLDHNAAGARQVALGTSYLITDYPRAFSATEKYSLSSRRYGGKLAGTRAYAEFLLRHLSSGTLEYAHPFENLVQSGVARLSARNLAALAENTAPLTRDEKAVLAKIGAAAPPVIIRMEGNRFERILESDLALAPREVGILNGQVVSTYTFTPSFEDRLYGAWDYLFAGIGQNNRAGLYGDVQVFVSSRAWAERSYATEYSGMRLSSGAVSGEPDPETRRRWSDIIVAPEDYSGYLALAYIKYSRGPGGAGALKTMEAASGPAEIYGALTACETCYLEGKILKYFTLDEIDCVELPAEKPVPPLASKLKGRVFSSPGSCLK